MPIKPRNVFLILLILNMLLITVQLKDEKGTYFLEKTIGSVTLPILEYVKKTSAFVVETFNTYVNNVNAAKRFYEFSRKMEKLKAERLLCLRLKDENKRLKSLLMIKYTYNYKFIGTRVIDTSAFSEASIITVDKGKNSGVRENCAVIDEFGVVGRVWKLFPNQSQVQLISDNSSGVGVVIPERGIGGILNGTGNLYFGNLNFVPRDVTVKKGDLVFTSGTDGVYPPNILVGKVEEVKKGKDFFLSIKVRFAARLSALRQLVIVVGEDLDE